MAKTRETTIWGSRIGTGAASIDIVLMAAKHPLTVSEIKEDVRRRGLQERGAVVEHLRSLRERGHVVQTESGWIRA